MNKQEFYSQIPRLKRRLYTLGLLSAALFLGCWYLGGYQLWGRLIDLVLFPINAYYEPGGTDRAAIVYKVPIGGEVYRVFYRVNSNFSPNMVVLVTLLATWIRPSFKHFLKLCGWCLVYLIIYQCFSVLLHFHLAAIGPDMADKAGVFWEENTWYLTVRKLGAFDKFILRYFTWIGIFLGALVSIYFFPGNGAASTRSSKQRARS